MALKDYPIFFLTLGTSLATRLVASPRSFKYQLNFPCRKKLCLGTTLAKPLVGAFTLVLVPIEFSLSENSIGPKRT